MTHLVGHLELGSEAGGGVHVAEVFAAARKDLGVGLGDDEDGLSEYKDQAVL